MKFSILQRISNGAEGGAWLLRDEKSDQRFRAKSIQPNPQQETLYRLLQTIHHPLLPQPVAWGDACAEGIGPVVVYPWIEGEPLDAAWSNATENRRSEWTVDLLRALDLLHFHQRVHGDLKPANLLIDSEQRLRVIDLEWSYAPHESLDRRTGTTAYMAPETLEGEPPDGRSDLYSLGLVLYGLRAQPDADRISIDQRMRRDANLEALPNDDPWKPWLEKCCRLDPRKRWDSAWEAYENLPANSGTPFFDAELLCARFRPLPDQDGRWLEELLNKAEIQPAPDGYFHTQWEPEADNLGRWESLIASQPVLDRCNARPRLTEALLESIEAETSSQNPVDEKERPLSPPVGALDEAYDAGELDRVLERGPTLLNDPSLPESERAYVSNLIGLSHLAQAQLEEALVAFLDVRQRRENCGDAIGEAKALNNAAMVHQRMGAHRLAESRYLEALRLAREGGDRKRLSEILFNLAALESELGRLEEAEGRLEEAQQIFSETGLDEQAAQCAFNRSLIVAFSGRFDAAIDALDQALEALDDSHAMRSLLILRKKETLMEAERYDEAMAVEEPQDAPPPTGSHGRMPLRIAFRSAAYGLGEFPEGLRPENAETWLETWTHEAERAEMRFYCATYLLNRGEEEAASRQLARIDEDAWEERSLLRLRLAILLFLAAEGSEQGEAMNDAGRRIEVFLTRWSGWAPKRFQRELWAHPLYRSAQKALERLRRFRRPESALEETRATLQATRALARLTFAVDAQTLIEWALEALLDVSRAERGFVILLEEGRQTVAAALNLKKESIEDPQFEISRSLLSRAMESGEIIITTNAQEESGLGPSVYDLHLLSVYVVPLIHQGEVLGAVYLDHRYRKGAFEEASGDLLNILSSQIASSLIRQRLTQQLEEKAKALEKANRLLSMEVKEQKREAIELQERLAAAQRHLKDRYGPGRMIGESPVVNKLLEQAMRLADAEVPVLITGESGTGKELMARIIHYGSRRSEYPFLAINCAALPDELVESELFGHKKGAFTGADRDRAGAFAQAERGTIFLDEIGSMELPQQVKLLRVLQESEVTPLGASVAQPVDARVLTATNDDLATLVKEGRFREDLYYRLNGVNLHLPPLRERREDIPLLIEHFRRGWETESGKRATFEPDRMERWMRREWPGNVRQLQNFLQRFFLLGVDPLENDTDSQRETTLGKSDWLQRYAPLDGGKDGVKRALGMFERDLIEAALERADGVKVKAADLLGVNKQDLNYRLRKLEMK